jgi:hypothetical protein
MNILNKKVLKRRNSQNLKQLNNFKFNKKKLIVMMILEILYLNRILLQEIFSQICISLEKSKISMKKLKVEITIQNLEYITQ